MVPTAVATEGDAPARVALAPVAPNPSRARATVTIETPGAARVVVYDLLGREVARVADGAAEAGWPETRLDASALASGVYIVWLRAGDETRTRRITVLR